MVVMAVAAFVWASRPVVVEAPVGERVAVRLPDGSAVTLNSGSTLHRARLFGTPLAGAREVELVGEAFFDVTEGGAPFIVRTVDAEVTVLGTRFGVRGWDDAEGATTVALLEGRVRLTPTADRGAAIVLTPGEVGRVEAAASLPVVEGAGVEDALAWRSGDLVYKDRPLGVVLADVERRFGVAVVPNPSSLAFRRVSVALRDPASAEAVVQDLATALGLRYRRTAAGFELSEAPVAL
jgi:ferric-dicitrate binding protein FerR (iron transport regulator)